MVQPAPAAQPGAGDAWSTGRPRWWRVAAVVIAVTVLLPSLLIRHLLARLAPGVTFCGSGSEPELALTIDDGPSGRGSNVLLDLLRELEVPATFFLIGSRLRRNPRSRGGRWLRGTSSGTISGWIRAGRWCRS
ncbi:MAG: polysaccharide deacetylase family protein [Cyanobacteria bacterium]|nr:polysaccharide deacetylase family protein [Cyanobacteriota bacterium]